MFSPEQKKSSPEQHPVMNRVTDAFRPDVCSKQRDFLLLLAGLKDLALEGAARSGYSVINADN